VGACREQLEQYAAEWQVGSTGDLAGGSNGALGTVGQHPPNRSAMSMDGLLLCSLLLLLFATRAHAFGAGHL
jgi:hypothetical protein